MLTPTHRAVVLESRVENVDRAESAADEVAATAGFDEPERHRIAMAVREITVNAITHGNHCDAGKKVTIEFSVSPHDLVIQVRDQGEGFDAHGLPDPLAPDNLLRQSGRGIFLARAFMDDVQLRSNPGGTEVRMSKHRPGTV
ncbi:MAG: ATP-binding protein [Terriglobales bacterium]